MKFTVKRTINAPANTLWSYLADYSNIHRFNPMLKHSDFNEGSHTCEVGSTRQCDMKGRDYLRERITDWQEGSHYSVDIYDTSMPVVKASATLGVNKLGENKSEAYMSVDMTPKYKITEPMMYLFFRFYGAPAILRGLDKLYHKEAQLSVAT